MKSFRFILIAVLGLLGTNVLAQTTLQEAVAPGNKVYFQLVNDKDHPIPDDEIEDVTRELVNAGQWVSVATPEEADFILKVEAKKRVVVNSPRTWLTPYVLDKDGKELWKSKTQQADATMFNGYRATNTCIKKLIEKSFVADLFKKAGRE
ncbi:MAG: hypothetical protein II454_07795 [Bacteroidales bacterium]|nr:hypothetical protein [Bacteroidales bacterium]